MPPEERAAGAPLRVVLAIDRGPREVEERAVELPAGSRLCDAIVRAGFAPACEAGIWGRVRPADTPLADGDRIELYRPLRVDPKTARRERFDRQGARATGLFARRP